MRAEICLLCAHRNSTRVFIGHRSKTIFLGNGGPTQVYVGHRTPTRVFIGRGSPTRVLQLGVHQNALQRDKEHLLQQ